MFAREGGVYDYVIVGGGAAGCVLAARLSEDDSAKVLLLEAGPVDKNPYIHMPVGFYKMTDGPLTWGYRTTAIGAAKGREMLLPQGRVLGGGSSINAQVYTRGHAADYDRWANEEGCPGWSYADVLPYFRKSEHNDTYSNDYHGVGGPQGVSYLLSPNAMSKVFVVACQEAGIPFNPDFNGAVQEGCGHYQTTTLGGKRCSTAAGHLKPALGRPNLTMHTGCLVTRVVVVNGRATGVTYVLNGRAETAQASEVIVAAGAIGSPKLLMLSGIGPADDLRGHGIEVENDLPGVGRNLHDHYDIDIVYELHEALSLDKYKKPHMKLLAGIEYKLFGTGPATSNLAECGAFWSVDPASETPDTQFHFMAGAGVEAGVPPVASGSGCTLNSYFLRPRSRGTVTLQSRDPSAAPIIDPNYLAEPYDVKVSVDGVKMMRELMGQPALARYLKGEHFPGNRMRTDAEYEDYVRQHGRTAYHPVGTCRMGSGDDAVVGPDLKVKGVDGLRVADSSVMPSINSSNTNAPTIMIAEKAADLIKAA